MCVYADFQQSADVAHQQLAALSEQLVSGVLARIGALQQEVRMQVHAGTKTIELRIDELTTCRSQAAMVLEESARVMRMGDYAMMAHAASVERNASRMQIAWHQYLDESLLPEPLQLLIQPQLVIDELQVLGAIHVPMRHVQDGCDTVSQLPKLPVSTQAARVEQLDASMRAQEAAKQQEVVQLEAILREKAAEHEQAARAAKQMQMELHHANEQAQRANADWRERTSRFLIAAKVRCHSCGAAWPSTADGVKTASRANMLFQISRSYTSRCKDNSHNWAIGEPRDMAMPHPPVMMDVRALIDAVEKQGAHD